MWSIPFALLQLIYIAKKFLLLFAKAVFKTELMTSKRRSGRGITLRNELLYTMVKLGLIPYWLDMKNGMKIAVGSPTPRIIFK